MELYDNKIFNYISVISKLNREIIRLFFNEESKISNDLNYYIEKNYDMIHYDENLIDFKYVIDYLLKNIQKLKLTQDIEDKTDLKNFLKNAKKLRNGIWHNSLPKNLSTLVEYFDIFKKGYEFLKLCNNLNENLLSKSILYINLAIEYINNKENNNI